MHDMTTTFNDPVEADPNPNTTAATTRWLRLARAAAITMFVWSLILQLTAGQLIPPVLIVGAVFLGFAPFLAGERRRLGLAFSVTTLVLMAGNAPFLIDDLANPESSPTFILGLLSFLAGLVAIGSGFAGWRAIDRGSVGRVALGAGSLFVVGAVLSLIAASATDSQPPVRGDVELVASGVEWSVDAIEVDASGGIWVDNRDGVRHTFTIESEGLDLEIPAFKSRRSDLELEPGTYGFVCAVPGHEHMTGTLLVSG